MSQPAIYDHLFDDLDRSMPEVDRIFTPIINELQEFLNEIPCLRNVQMIRKQVYGRVRYSVAFHTPINDLYPKHWYIFHKGGRNEMQFNIGMYGEKSCKPPELPYVRIGVGFNFTKDGWGDPPKVERAFHSFQAIVRQSQTQFGQFAGANNLGIERSDSKNKWGGWLPFNNTQGLIAWLLNPPPTESEYDWIFIGRRLQRRIDRMILEDPKQLKKIIESVLCGFKPFWEQTLWVSNGQ